MTYPKRDVDDSLFYYLQKAKFGEKDPIIISIQEKIYIFEGYDNQLDILNEILNIRREGKLDLDNIKRQLLEHNLRDLQAAKDDEEKHFKVSLETLPPINPLIQILINNNKKDLDLIVFENNPNPKQSMSFFISSNE